MKNTVTGVVVIATGFILVYMLKVMLSGSIGMLMATLKTILGYTLMISGALCEDTKLWSNPLSKFISRVSLEIYIAYMMVFRGIEKLGLTTIAGESVVSYSFTCVLTIAGAVIFATVYQYIEKRVKRKLVVRGYRSFNHMGDNNETEKRSMGR